MSKVPQSASGILIGYPADSAVPPCPPGSTASQAPRTSPLCVIEQATETVLTNIRVQRKIRCDMKYLGSGAGITKVIELVLALLGLIAACMFAQLRHYFSVTCIFVILVTSTLLVLYITHFIEKYYKLPWLQFEMIYCIFATIVFVIVSLLIIIEGALPPGVIGLMAAVAFGYDSWKKIVGVKNYAIAQGERTVVTKTTHFSGPALNVPPLTASMINIPPIQICSAK